MPAERSSTILRAIPLRALDRLAELTQPFPTPGDLSPSPIHLIFQVPRSRV